MLNDLFRSGRTVLLDGGMGTMLLARGLRGVRSETAALTHRADLVAIHRAYVEAGAQLLCASTFAANRRKLADSGCTLAQVVPASIAAAREAAAGRAYVALDVGPLGELMEPNGTLTFADAYAQFSELAQLGEAAGADAVYLETMTALEEIRAAVLAVKENTRLPVFASMSFEADGRTFTGCPVEVMGTVLTGLGADAVGINCSLGPAEILPLARRLCAVTPLPVFIKANAGLPDPDTGEYRIGAEEFAREMEPYKALGIAAVGGCCGTTPAFIRLLAAGFSGVSARREAPPQRRVLCSATTLLDVTACPRAVGERINPTGRPRLQQAVRAGDTAQFAALAAQQTRCGAELLDVNVGVPGTDEAQALPAAVRAVAAVSAAPLVLDSSDPAALAAALRVYCGKALVNSVHAEEASLAAVLPLCRRYGAAVVGLCVDENGVPPTAEARFAAARRIAARCEALGIPRADVYIDALTLTAAADEGGAAVTLETLRRVRRELGVGTILGVSNISFGLPRRPAVSAAFLTMALQTGLDLAIFDPAAPELREAFAAFRLLTGRDPGAQNYLACCAGAPAAAARGAKQVTLAEAVREGLAEEARAAAAELLRTAPPAEIIDRVLLPALDEVGERFERGDIFLPTLLRCADAASAAFEAVRAAMAAAGTARSGKPIVLATVKGDVHDIGKNIVRTLLANYGYEVIDLGRDVPAEAVVAAVRRSGAKLAGLSALMTTTTPAMRDTVAALKAAVPDCAVMVGGAVVTERFARDIGADDYAADAKQSADIARRRLG